uniref:DNA methylase adenine-specific domain-containing protein n=1 Tax=Johnson-sea-linkia profunda TaxID=575876 RepID=A0A386AXK5_9CHLO|nr:hypothetical protein [Johnson-sea-linkia profunda]
MLDKQSIAYVVGELQNYSLIDSERDVIADAFETFIGHALKGTQGQFFTPRNVVKMIVEILNPDENDHIIDPACGSGGFLIESLKFVWNKLSEKYSELGWSDVQIENKKIEIATSHFRGIDKDYFLTKVAKVYMNLIGDGKTGVFCEDTLENPQNWSIQTRSKIQLGEFDILMTNPPFGSKIAVRGEAKLKEFELGYKWQLNEDINKWYKSNKLKKQEEPQVLFIERCLQLLKEGGKMAVVVPNGILGNEREIYLREYIKHKGHLFGIVQLPFETFNPNVSINTSVLFIQKSTKKSSKLFISINEFCGHDKKGRPIDKDDIRQVSKFFHNNILSENNFFIDPFSLEHSFIAKRYLKKYEDNLNAINKSQYPAVPLGSLIQSIHNGANIDDASIYVEKEKGIPYILVKSITKEGINFENLKYIKKDLITNREVMKNTVSETTIVMTRAGKSGISSNIPPDLVNGVASGFLMNIHVDLKKVNQYYLVAYLNSRLGQLQLERICSGSILTSIRSWDLKKVLVILPPMEVQKSIGNKIQEVVYTKTEIRNKMKNADREINNLIEELKIRSDILE